MRDANKDVSPESGCLSIVATPIGNLEDISFRAVRTLKEATQILAEDTRRTRKLCTHFDIRTPLRAYHAHSAEKLDTLLCERMLEGARYALVSDAGMPLLSDPGGSLVAAAVDNGISVACIPGPSAVLMSLVLSGLSAHGFTFVGFLARSGARRKTELRAIKERMRPTVFFESPKRLASTLKELAEYVEAERNIAVCRELTKMHEEVLRGTIENVSGRLPDQVLGEISVVVDGASELPRVTSVSDLDDRIAALFHKALSLKEIVQTIALETGQSRRVVYQRAIALKKEHA